MKFGIVGLGGPSSQLLLEEAKQYFDSVDAIDIRNIEVETNNKDIGVIYNDKPLGKYDCLYIKGSYKYSLLQRSLTSTLQNSSYLPIKPDAFTVGHDKFLTLIALKGNKIPIPKTYLAATTKIARKILSRVEYPIMIKIPSGTQGKGVMVADTIASAKSVLDTLEIFKQPYIIEEYVETGATDIRCIVAGSKVIASMERKAIPGELRANIHLGAVGTPVELDYNTKQIAIKSAEIIGAEICGVDILQGREPYVIEVNLSPGLIGITKATKKNVAREIVEYLYNRTQELSNTKKEKDYNGVLKELNLTGSSYKQEILTNLDIKSGRIKLPTVVTELSGFKPDEEVKLIAEKGKILIKK